MDVNAQNQSNHCCKSLYLLLLLLLLLLILLSLITLDSSFMFTISAGSNPGSGAPMGSQGLSLIIIIIIIIIIIAVHKIPLHQTAGVSLYLLEPLVVKYADLISISKQFIFTFSDACVT